jgi:hypothetical protein
MNFLWSAGACSRFFGVSNAYQSWTWEAGFQSRKRRPFAICAEGKQTAALQNVGAPTFPKWNCGGRGRFAVSSEGLWRMSARSLGLEKLRDCSSTCELAKLGSSNAGPLRKESPHRRWPVENVGAPTKIGPAVQAFRPEGFRYSGTIVIERKSLAPEGVSYRVAA